jgi:hypothetical protein
MKITLDQGYFKARFGGHGRPSKFTSDALDVLFDYFTSLEECTGEEMELDVTAINGDWGEFTLDALNDEYGYLLNNPDDDLMEALENRTLVLEVCHYGKPDTYLVMCF